MATYQGKVISGELAPGGRCLRTISGFISPKSILNGRQIVYQGSGIIGITNSCSCIRSTRKFGGYIVCDVINESRKVIEAQVSILPQGLSGSRLVTINKGNINPTITVSNRPDKVVSGYMGGNTESSIQTITVESSSPRKLPSTWRRKSN